MWPVATGTPPVPHKKKLPSQCARPGPRIKLSIQLKRINLAEPGELLSNMAAPFQGPGSDELRGQSCQGMCGRDTPRVAEGEVPRLLAALPAWELAPGGTAISRRFTARNFTAAMEFFNAVARLAEAEGHHPDLHLTAFRDVRVDLQTHAIGGLSLPDFILASKIDALPVEYSPAWLRKHAGQQQGGGT